MRPRIGILALVVCAALAGPARSEEARLTLLHTTDLHDALTSYDYLGDREYARGLVRIATMVKSVRAEGRPMLLLDAGDCLTGGPIGAAMRAIGSTRPDPMIGAMNMMGYDAMAVGNHEFDLLPAAREAARKAATFPWLAANIVRADGAPAFGTSIVKDMKGVRVGVIGLCTPAVPSWEDSANWAGLRFTSPVEAASAEAKRLKEDERCDVIVIVAHTGLEKDPGADAERKGDTPQENWGARLATQVPGVNVVILGHTHVVVASQRFGNVVATQAGRWGEHLGRVDLTLTRASAAEPWQVRAAARVLAVTDTVRADSALAEFARPYHADTQAWLSQTVGSARADLTTPRGRLENSAPWELIHRAQLEASGADVSLASLFDSRLRFRKGPITNRDLLGLYGYDNTLVKVSLTGAELKHTLEQSAAYFQTYTYEHDRPLAEPGRPGFNYDAASGVQYEIDLTRPAGDRIVNLLYKGAPLDPGRRLTVAVNNYRANGGGGFDAIVKAPRLWRSEKTVRDLIADEVRAGGPLGPGFDRNWRLLPDYAPTAERPLIDRLVREGIAPAGELLRMESDEPARRGDLAYWLARAYGWRAKKASGAFADVPDSLEPWLDGLLQHKALGSMGEGETIAPFAIAPLGQSLDWCVGAARHAKGYDLLKTGDVESFRRSLVTGLGFAKGVGGRDVFRRDTLTRAEVLGLVSNTRFPTLRVLETTDLHGFLLPGATDRRSGRAIGGSPVLAAWIERLRGENPEGTLLIDGGDCFQGTMISNLQFGRPVVEQMNALRYTAMAVGNHEFDWTVDTLARRVSEMHFSALAANMVTRKTKQIPWWARPDTMFVRRGLMVGVLGLAYRYTPTVTLAANVAHLTFEDDSATAARVVPTLRKRGARAVFGVGHIPAEADSLRRARGGDLVRLARGIRGVDAWFGGHSHNQVLDEIGGVPLMIAGAHGEVVAVCDVVMDPVKGAPIERRARLQLTYADEVTPDSAMAARLERWNANVAPIAAQELGRNARTLTRNRNTESSLGDFVTDAMREASGAAIAMQNSGGLRADLAAGVVTRGAIYEVMPFDNTVVTMDLTGAEVRRVFEEGLRYGRVAQLSGVRIAFDLDKPDFQRVTRLTLADGTPIDDAKTYSVAVNNFMATGGDNFDSLAKGKNIKDTGIVIRTTLEDYVAKRAKRGEPLDVKLDGRIQRTGGGTAPAGDR